MNSEKTDFNKIALIRKLEILRELEMKKPINEIDTDFIDEIVLFGLELKGLKAALTPEEVEEKVRKIPFVEKTTTLNTPPTSVKGRATKVKSHKILLIAAIISILVAIFTISSIAFDWNIFDELKNRFGTVADTPVNEAVDVNGVSVYMYGDVRIYHSIEDALLKENINVCYPTNLPENIIIKQVSLHSIDAKDRVTFASNNPKFTYFVEINESVPEQVLLNASEIVNINDFKCYLVYVESVDATQIYFEYESDLYYLSYNNRQDLIKVIENLKELK